MIRYQGNYRNGFTIVELLIVVVVIAILAAITIVSYNGITKRAQAAAHHSNAREIMNKLNLFYSQNNRYPEAGDTEMTDGASPESLPEGVTVIYTDINAQVIRNYANTTTSTYPPFTMGTYLSALYTNTNTGVKMYVAKACRDINDPTKTLGLKVYYPDPTTNYGELYEAKHIDVGNTTNCVMSVD